MYVRLLWSRSPSNTVDIFKMISLTHEEVDVDKAVSVGTIAEGYHGDEEDKVNGDSNFERQGYYGFNIKEDARLTAQDILLFLPGINVHNFRE